MAWEILAETRISDAIERGEFGNLPGVGRPIDLEGYFAMPGEVRVGHQMLKDAGVVPPEVECMQAIAELERELAACADQALRRQIKERLEAQRVAFSLRMEMRRAGRRSEL